MLNKKRYNAQTYKNLIIHRKIQIQYKHSSLHHLNITLHPNHNNAIMNKATKDNNRNRNITVAAGADYPSKVIHGWGPPPT